MVAAKGKKSLLLRIQMSGESIDLVAYALLKFIVPHTDRNLEIAQMVLVQTQKAWKDTSG